MGSPCLKGPAHSRALYVLHISTLPPVLLLREGWWSLISGPRSAARSFVSPTTVHANRIAKGLRQAEAGALKSTKKMKNADKTYRCSYCGNHFLTAAKLEKHFKTLHERERLKVARPGLSLSGSFSSARLPRAASCPPS